MCVFSAKAAKYLLLVLIFYATVCLLFGSSLRKTCFRVCYSWLMFWVYRFPLTTLFVGSYCAIMYLVCEDDYLVIQDCYNFARGYMMVCFDFGRLCIEGYSCELLVIRLVRMTQLLYETTCIKVVCL
ncbi:hypothetical protein HanXRQr2_Chr11g0485321 [Helianthus annuus]|uniref:Uncharacterized protein n=1 Tax=Helianthus annuus TaxID=4232 RepID=A0A9K3HNS5_HELAN|nr:hypothetical protein HanXRQr2_Chr11g0485321 [Helianthus annuus]